MTWLYAMNYAHLMMLVGAVLVLIGFVGYALRKNRNEQEQVDEIEAQGK
jgi:cbb3-type cytochrome oxidase subunit 3